MLKPGSTPHFPLDSTYLLSLERTHMIEVVEKRINSIGSSQNKDYAINGFAHGLVAKDPERALKWANSIKDETMHLRPLCYLIF